MKLREGARELVMGDIYLWHQTYLDAMCETDDARLPGRILEARSAIEQRLLSPIDPAEFAAIENAKKALELLWTQHDQRKGPSH